MRTARAHLKGSYDLNIDVVGLSQVRATLAIQINKKKVRDGT